MLRRCLQNELYTNRNVDTTELLFLEYSVTPKSCVAFTFDQSSLQCLIFLRHYYISSCLSAGAVGYVRLKLEAVYVLFTNFGRSE